MRLAAHTRTCLPVFSLSSSSCDSIMVVVLSQSAAVPAPAQYMLGAILCSFLQFLSATMGPPVALVSAPSTTPSLNTTPQMVVPVFTVFGAAKPLLAKNSFL